LADRIRQKFPSASIELVKGRGGIFLVTTPDTTLWDKHAQDDQFPDEGFILDQLG